MIQQSIKRIHKNVPVKRFVCVLNHVDQAIRR